MIFSGFLILKRGDYVFARAMEGGNEETDVLQLFVPSKCVLLYLRCFSMDQC